MDEFTFIDLLKLVWLYLMEAPWRRSATDDDEAERVAHWFMWAEGWAWAIAGFALGAFVAPSLIDYTGLTHSPYQGFVATGIAVLTGFLVQILSLLLIYLVVRLAITPAERKLKRHLPNWIIMVLAFVFIPLPIACVGYGIYRYLTWVGASQRSVTVAFVGALLVKTFLIPFIKGIVTGALFKWFMSWLRGNKAKPRGA